MIGPFCRLPRIIFAERLARDHQGCAFQPPSAGQRQWDQKAGRMPSRLRKAGRGRESRAAFNGYFGHSAELRRYRTDATGPGALILWLGWPYMFRDRYGIGAPERCRKSRSACDLTNHGLGRGGFCNRRCPEALEMNPSLGMDAGCLGWVWTLRDLEDLVMSRVGRHLALERRWHSHTATSAVSTFPR